MTDMLCLCYQSYLDMRSGAQHAMLTSFMNAPANGEDQMTSFFFTKEHF